MRCHIPENTIGWFYMWSVDIITLKLIQCVIFKDMTILVRTIFYLLQDGYIYILDKWKKVHLHMIYADLSINQPVIFQLATLTSQGV